MPTKVGIHVFEPALETKDRDLTDIVRRVRGERRAVASLTASLKRKTWMLTSVGMTVKAQKSNN